MTPEPTTDLTRRHRPPRRPERRVLRASSPEDLLALVPIVIGFEPEHCIVMLTFGSLDCFHARVDLPPVADLDDVEALDAEADALHGVVEMLLAPARRHRVTAAAFVLYCADPAVAAVTAELLHEAFGSAGIEQRAVLRTDGSRWFGVDGSLGAVPLEGVAYDVSAHPFRVQSVVDGTVTHGSRAELAASLQPDPDAVARVQAVRGGAPHPGPTQVATWLARHLAAGTTFSDVELAAVAGAIVDREVRDAVWGPMSRDTATEQVELWSDAARRTPPDLGAGVAAVLGFACWLAGQGALAWCAVDRARALDPHDSLAHLVAGLLTDAVPPSSWTPQPLG